MLVKPVPITEQAWPEGTVPTVSVFNWTYNHAMFIRASIDSILMQETTFPVEIIIHDDASTDGTTEIIRQYEAIYPHLFRNILQEENQLSQGRSVMKPLYAAPLGEFIALTHGDDYWTSESKLQKQVEMLMCNPQASLAYHPIVSERNGQKEVDVSSDGFRVKSVADVLQIRGIHTSAMVFRRCSLPGASAWMHGLPVGDIPLQLHLADSGEILFMPEESSVYRKHPGGWTAGARLETPRVVDSLRQVLLGFNRYTRQRYRALIFRRLLELHIGAVAAAEQESDRKAVSRHRWLAMTTWSKLPEVSGLINCVAGNVFGPIVRKAYFRLCTVKNSLLNRGRLSSKNQTRGD